MAYEDLDPYVRRTRGHRQFLALAMDWRVGSDSKLEWEVEYSQRQQMGVNGYSLWGNALPVPVDSKTNLTRQDWSQPTLFAASTSTLRWTQNLANGWQWRTSYGEQFLKTDDRLAFALGCSAEDVYVSDRFCGNGSFDVYDYRSETSAAASKRCKPASAARHAHWGSPTT